jgi:hypothetical protein
VRPGVKNTAGSTLLKSKEIITFEVSPGPPHDLISTDRNATSGNARSVANTAGKNVLTPLMVLQLKDQYGNNCTQNNKNVCVVASIAHPNPAEDPDSEENTYDICLNAMFVFANSAASVEKNREAMGKLTKATEDLKGAKDQQRAAEKQRDKLKELEKKLERIKEDVDSRIAACFTEFRVDYRGRLQSAHDCDMAIEQVRRGSVRLQTCVCVCFVCVGMYIHI